MSEEELLLEWIKNAPSGLRVEGITVSKKKFKIRFRGVPDLFDEEGQTLTTELAFDLRKGKGCITRYEIMHNVADCYAEMRIRKGQQKVN